MNGILNIYKPRGMTSHDVVSFVRRTLHMKKVGHTGTLDPEAEGVLPICVGSGTKASDMLTDADKAYRATLLLGITTDTEDSTGKIISQAPCKVSKEELLFAISKFIGEIEQIPPMFSAIKQNGKKLYELARQGICVERKPRRITIYDIKLIKYEENRAVIDVYCSKGTYIRTLCADIGSCLGCGGCMDALIRIKSGRFTIEDAISLDVLKEAEGAEKYLIPTDELFPYPKLFLNPVQSARVRSGVPIYYENANLGETYRLYDENKRFLSISQLVEKDGRTCLKLLKSFYGETN